MGDEPPRKRCGRKPLDPSDVSVSVNITMPAKMFAALRERARREQITVPEAIRRSMREAKKQPGED
jgi:hypothetical protein